ncbi:MAG: hypothetical protein WD359_05815 [Dehalococcoidia bacterium]
MSLNRRLEPDESGRGEAVRAEAEAFGAKFSDYNIIAAYENMGAAKKAIDALQLAGIDGAEYSLLGATVADAESHVDNASIHEADVQLTNDWLRHSVIWGGVGAVIGGTVGAVLAAIPGTPLAFWYWLILGIIVGGTLGAFVGAMLRMDASDNADAPYRVTSNRHVLLGVISQDANRVERAEGVLSRAQPLSLHRYDRRGQLQT